MLAKGRRKRTPQANAASERRMPTVTLTANEQRAIATAGAVGGAIGRVGAAAAKGAAQGAAAALQAQRQAQMQAQDAQQQQQQTIVIPAQAQAVYAQQQPATQAMYAHQQPMPPVYGQQQPPPAYGQQQPQYAPQVAVPMQVAAPAAGPSAGVRPAAWPYVITGVCHFLTNPSLWPYALIPLAVGLIVTIVAFTVIFGTALAPQQELLQDTVRTHTHPHRFADRCPS